MAQFFHQLVRQPIRAFGVHKLAELRQYFVDHDCNMRMLAKEIVVQTALNIREKEKDNHRASQGTSSKTANNEIP